MKSSNLSNSLNLSSPLNHFREKNDAKGPVSMLSMMQNKSFDKQMEPVKVQQMEERARSRLSEFDPADNTNHGRKIFSLLQK